MLFYIQWYHFDQTLSSVALQPIPRSCGGRKESAMTQTNRRRLVAGAAAAALAVAAVTPAGATDRWEFIPADPADYGTVIERPLDVVVASNGTASIDWPNVSYAGTILLPGGGEATVPAFATVDVDLSASCGQVVTLRAYAIVRGDVDDDVYGDIQDVTVPDCNNGDNGTGDNGTGDGDNGDNGDGTSNVVYRPVAEVDVECDGDGIAILDNTASEPEGELGAVGFELTVNGATEVLVVNGGDKKEVEVTGAKSGSTVILTALDVLLIEQVVGTCDDTDSGDSGNDDTDDTGNGDGNGNSGNSGDDGNGNSGNGDTRDTGNGGDTGDTGNGDSGDNGTGDDVNRDSGSGVQANQSDDDSEVTAATGRAPAGLDPIGPSFNSLALWAVVGLGALAVAVYLGRIRPLRQQ